ncbi:phosphate ABC transporter permease subunit PstC [Rhodomicrobium vannielii ATCC 17100]|uniref:phosphate ABC transporter permease subunit PstC n=1 Tax=Rhodomicrobium vannielii TaxID=1069 RepID=UPI0019185D8B|nr:phosphate ABC transporter permease subunit PstC [Rhodomicrobium vannielii ATCC 17100]
MSLSALLFCLLLAAIVAFVIGFWRAKRLSPDNPRALHSRPGYHGGYLALWTALPAILVLLVWSAVEPRFIQAEVESNLPAQVLEGSEGQIGLAMGVVRSVATGLERLTPAEVAAAKASPREAQRLFESKGVVIATPPNAAVIASAEELNNIRHLSRLAKTAVAAFLAIFGFIFAFRKLSPNLRARNRVEQVVILALMAASSVAIMTTVGIVLSVLFESIAFFKHVSIIDFLTGTIWDPRFASAGDAGGQGQFGLLPLMWGTLYISIVALVVAVPIGLLAAIYMSEYAHPKVRATVKPALEMLAGIPTIVYGFFAVVTVGPFLNFVGSEIGLVIQPTSVLTAGIVMGIMIIPFVSSLSDDIISAIPNALREGSYGLGATQSETIKRVVLPAALPGIVGAILLAASRAIGETMIVVLAAGIAANLTLNPAESVTTITVKIVSQLTGDLEFNTPQTLVAFALGFTLFILTLGLNVYALYIVRKYREQYE